MLFDDENINTEKFTMNMHGINSTLLVEPAIPAHIFPVPNYEEKKLDFSISMEEDELSNWQEDMQKNASNTNSVATMPPKVQEVPKDVFKMPGLPVPVKKTVVAAKFEIYQDSVEEEEVDDLSKSIYYEVSLKLI